MRNNEEFQPCWCSPPGITIADALKEKGLSATEFCSYMSGVTNHAYELLSGDMEINHNIARRLGEVVGGSEHFWIMREKQYRAGLARLQKEKEETEAKDWLRQLPIKDMRRFGWLSTRPSGKTLIDECLEFFGVPTVGAWQERYNGVLKTAAYRTSNSFESEVGAVAAWLRRGEVEGAQIKCSPWNAEQFYKALSEVRRLTWKKNPSLFLKQLSSQCAECGVALVIVRGPKGCRASGATRFLSKDKALILLSFRYLTDDHFWFTFFHEAGHLLLHGKKAMFLEGTEAILTEEEEQANNFAVNTLIPPESQEELFDLPTSSRAVLNFAKRVGIAPGIIVGQLQHAGRIQRNQLNGLKRRFKWV